ncbi:hypothetical protein ACFY97_31105 [Streptomyces klenkii]|uniref:hypothetical protein n=1 Tax=Streptomyces klenkii TaxID=1420899 RepID=UPI0036EEBCA6
MNAVTPSRNGSLSLETVARGVPLVDDRLLLELTNDLHTAHDLTRAAGREGFFARLLGRATGRDRIRERTTRDRMLSSQQLTLRWLTHLSERMTVTDLVVAEVSEEVHDAKKRIERVEAAGQWSAAAIGELGAILGRLASDTGRFLSDHERRLAALEAQLALDRSARRWRNPRPDPELPWLVGAVLLAREVASGPAGTYAFTGGETLMQRQLVERMLQDPPVPWFEGVKSVPAMLTAVVRDLPSENHRLMVAELLGLGVADELSDAAGPLTSALARATELAVAGADPDDAARAALRDSSGSGDLFLPSSLSVEQLVRRIVAEQFAEARQRRIRLRKHAEPEDGSEGDDGAGRDAR